MKSVTAELCITELPANYCYFLPLACYRGKMEPLVPMKTRVLKYQPVLQSTGMFGTICHSPVSGYVQELITMDGQEFLMIENDFEDEEIHRPLINSDAMSRQEILNHIHQCGIIGSGGAGFPTHVKYNTGDTLIDTFIINGAECEPYLTADYSVMKEKTHELMMAIKLVQKLIGAQKIVLALEKQHRSLKVFLEFTASELKLPFAVKLLPNTYPQGSELQLIKTITRKEIPRGAIPSQYGIVVSNTGTLWAIYQAFYENKPYIERIVTVSGELMPVKGNFKIRIGTPVSHILTYSKLSYKHGDMAILLGGPMMGREVKHPDIPITKGSGAVLALNRIRTEMSSCIRCGYCVDVCPQKLMPLNFIPDSKPEGFITGDRNSKEYLQIVHENHILNCIECSSCAYICPGNIALMNYIQNAKQLVLNQ